MIRDLSGSIQAGSGDAESAEKSGRPNGGGAVRWITDTDELSAVIATFETTLPGFWWSLGQCSVGAHASCSVDGDGVQSDLLEGVRAGNPLDGGFHCDTRGGSPAEALRNVMDQAVSFLKEAGLFGDRTNEPKSEDIE